MPIININLTRKYNYPIIIGDNLHDNITQLKYFFNPNNISNVILITNKILFNLYYPQLKFHFNKILKNNIDNFIISDIESNKKIETVELILSYLFQQRYGRDTLLLSLGGGIIGDICGTVSSIYYRGIFYISIPTTLLAQVDASIGGKNGINNCWGKNLIGTFYQPSAVIININYLYSLSTKDLQDGLAEVVKYAVAFDNNFFYWLDENILSLLNREMTYLEYCIYICCKLKSQVIQDDELEKYDKRILLNLGHTYAHALETYFKYKRFTHGQAVSIGIILSMYTANLMGFIKDQQIKEVINLLNRIDLPVKFPQDIDIDKYLKIMMHDKKINNGKLSLIIPKDIGKAQIYRDVSLELIRDALKIDQSYYI